MRTPQGDGPVLGLSFDYHDAAAAVVVDGRVVAAASEERFTRTKHDPSLPVHAMAYCLEDAGVGPDDLGAVTFYDKPFTKYERILLTHAKVGPRGFPTLAQAIGQWSRSKLWVGYRIERALRDLGYRSPGVTYAEHHQSHAASAFYPSPFERAAILTFDGIGEWATSSIAWGAGHRIEPLEELRFPDSLGLFYSAMTAFCGFAVNDGEYKLMGLAPFGTPRYADVLRDRVVAVGDDGAISLDQQWFDYRAGGRMTHPRMGDLLDGPPLAPNAELTQREADIARSVQVVVEDAVLAMARHARDLTGERTACLAGGVALNCVANQRLAESGIFDELWVQPAAGDDGGALGAALWTWYQLQGHHRSSLSGDGMAGAYLGPAFPASDIGAWLEDQGIAHERHTEEELCREVADALADGAIVGWFQGRMEFGPRALGNRSILADPRRVDMVRRLNLAVKRREGFRPFAPAVTAEDASEWFEVDGPLPYMVFTAQVAAGHRTAGTADDPCRPLTERLATVRSDIPACTHLDGSARVQTVDQATAPRFHRLLRAFGDRTGCPVLINTSFNRKDEPIVRSPSDAYACFVDTDMDLLVLEDVIIRKGADRAAKPLAAVAEAVG